MGQFDNLFKEITKDKSQEKPKTNKSKVTTNKNNTTKSQPKHKTKTNISKSSDVEKNEGFAENKKISKVAAKGKSSNSEYKQVLTYLKKDTHRRVRIALLGEAEKRDLSDLVEDLVYEWLSSKS